MRWGVVSTVSEPAPLVLSFVAHYLDLGAAWIDLHLDAPDPDLSDALASLPAVRVHCRTAWDWVRGGHFGPPSPPQRQVFNARQSHDTADVDWLLHVDADEFLIEPDAVFQTLRDLPGNVDALALAPVERVWIDGEPAAHIFDGAFRRQCSDETLLAPIYGDAMRYLDWGLSSNGRAKCFVRTGRGLQMGVHMPRGASGAAADIRHFPRPALLHFDGLTPRHYLDKLRRRISQEIGWWHFPASGRLEQMRAIHAAGDDDIACAEIVCAAKQITPEQAKTLASHNLLARHKFDPRPALERVFPGRQVDLGREGFDRHGLKEMHLPAIWRLWNDARARTFALRRRLRRGKGPDAH